MKTEKMGGTDTTKKTCTGLDHVYPKSKFGTRCYCGARTWGSKKISGVVQNVVDTGAQGRVDSISTNTSATISQATEPSVGSKQMELTLKGLSKNGKRAIYSGAAASLYFSIGAFPDSVAPATIPLVDGVFAPAKEKVVKAKLTKEERAELRKNAPKPTLAEKAAKLEERLKKLRAQAAAEASGASL